MVAASSKEQLEHVFRHELAHSFDEGAIGWGDYPTLSQPLGEGIYAPFFKCIKNRFPSALKSADRSEDMSREWTAEAWAVKGLSERIKNLPPQSRKELLSKTFENECTEEKVGHFRKDLLLNMLIGAQSDLRRALGCTPLSPKAEGCDFAPAP